VKVTDPENIIIYYAGGNYRIHTNSFSLWWQFQNS